ncbi:trypsin-like serine protease [Asanoa ishikariensis]|uniref:trypsin-like serine protease n=1 Tax=Asanoa ishikariensis TaxID=137265 RepID=UPI00115FC78E|nr:trypsin-like serine protease [Asanoa ishikariensis]
MSSTSVSRAVRSALVTTTVAIVTLVSVTGPASAAPKPGPGSGAVDELQVRQRPLVDAATALRAVVDEDRSNFAGIELVGSTELRLYWKGTPPAAVGTVVKRLRQSVPVKVIPAAYALRELKAEATRLVTTGNASGVVLAAPLADGSGLRVRVTSTATMTAARTMTAVPTSVEVGDAPTPTGRWADTVPFWGGSTIERPVNANTVSRCTTAFAGRRNNQNVLLTAGHCGSTGNAFTTPSGTYFPKISVGTANYKKADLEALFIPVSDHRGRIYDGGVDPTGQGIGEFSKGVAGWAPPEVGQYICQSGSYSGVRCSIRITLKWVTYALDAGTIVTNGVEAQRDDQANAVGKGDSGGPVFRLHSDPNRVIALGVQSAADPSKTTTCTGIATTCFWRLYFADMTQIVGHTGFTITVG